MADQYASHRNPKHGIVLIATLVSLILVVGFAMVVQSAGIANTRVIKRMTAEHQVQMDEASVRELLRPVIGEAMVDIDGNGDGIKFNGTPFEVRYNGRVITIVAQDVDGLINPFNTPESLVKTLLPAEWLELSGKIARSENHAMPLEMLAAQVGASMRQIQEIAFLLTRDGLGRPLNANGLPGNYITLGSRIAGRSLSAKQTNRAIVQLGTK